MNAGVVGCGLIGRKRAEGMKGNSKLVGCFDTSIETSRTFEKLFLCKRYSNVEELIQDSEIEYIVVATQHSDLIPIALRALHAGKHVFLEKPGAVISEDLQELASLALKKGLKIHIGYNHRFHPSLMKLFELIKLGGIGELMFLRGHYGHGGRLGYEKEWRAKKRFSGGGELIDQGSHLIDISLEILGDLNVEYAATPTLFWNMNVEDNAFLVLTNTSNNLAFLHASCTEWKNKFSLEVFGTLGKIEISGIGRSYGQEKLTYYRMLPEMGVPLKQEWIFPEEDVSWKLEIGQFVEDMKTGTNLSDNTKSSVRVLEIIEEIYRKTNR